MHIADKLCYNNFIRESACTNLFLTLAALGLFEITWEIPCYPPQSLSKIATWKNNLDFYPFGRIGYIHVTELGKYIFEITDKFEIAGVKNFAPPKLDEKSLIFHIEDGDKPMQIFLAPFCIPLSKTLFKADLLRLKKCCTTKNDVNNIFGTLSARTQGTLPQIWKNLKDEILESFVSLKSETDWHVFSLEGLGISAIREIEKKRTYRAMRQDGRQTHRHKKERHSKTKTQTRVCWIQGALTKRPHFILTHPSFH